MNEDLQYPIGKLAFVDPTPELRQQLIGQPRDAPGHLKRAVSGFNARAPFPPRQRTRTIDKRCRHAIITIVTLKQALGPERRFRVGRYEKEYSMKAALILLLFSVFPAMLLCAVSEDSFNQTYASSIVPYVKDNAVAGEIRMDDGATLGYQSIRNPREKGIVVLLGGHSESYVKYAELFYDLRDLGITFYALDLRGQGFSTRMLPDREKDFIPAYDRYLVDLKSFMKSVVRPRPNEKVLLLGHSLGGAVAAAYAERNPGDINGLILSSPYLGSKTGAPVLLLLRALDILGRGKEYVPGGGPFKFVTFEQNVETHSRVRHAQKMQDYKDHPEIRLGYPTNHWMVETERMGDDVVKNAKLISCPLLVFQAEDDRYAGSGAQDRFCAAIPHSKKIIFLGAYHEVLLESDSIRDLALAAIRNFVQHSF